jgi:hypothetical protein
VAFSQREHAAAAAAAAAAAVQRPAGSLRDEQPHAAGTRSFCAQQATAARAHSSRPFPDAQNR